MAAFRALAAAAIAAGLAAGLALTAVQAVATTPLILAAEGYERLAAAAVPATTDGDLARLGATALANVLSGVGFALVLVACMALARRPVNGRSGILWGGAGFAVFALAPALGLPPELPGAAAAPLAARQVWWLAAAAGASAGLWLAVFCRRPAARVLGIVPMALPHLAGAPAAPEAAGVVPAELAARFAAASLVTAAVFWVLLGWLAGMLYARLRPPAGASVSHRAPAAGGGSA